jgi:hypothetical protein
VIDNSLIYVSNTPPRVLRGMEAIKQCRDRPDRESVEKYKNCQEIMKTTYKNKKKKKKIKNSMLLFWYKKNTTR